MSRLVGKMIAFAFVAAGMVVVAVGSRAALGDAATESRIAIDDAHLCLALMRGRCPAKDRRLAPKRPRRAPIFGPSSKTRRPSAWRSTERPIVIARRRRCRWSSFRIDGGQFRAIQLTNRDKLENAPADRRAGPSDAASVSFYFRAASLGPDRWSTSAVHLRIAGIALDPGGSLLPCPARAKRAIGFGDSITEGVCAEGFALTTRT